MYNDFYYDGASEALAGGMLVGLGIFFIVLILICLAICIVKVVGTWKVLKKAGQPGWGALIPFYNTYLLCQITGVNPWWILITALAPVLSFIPFVGGLVTTAVTIYFSILLNISLAKSFGKDEGFAVGLVLIAPVFYMILGVGDSKYEGPKPMNDFVFDNINGNMGNRADYTTGQEKKTKFCSECGAKISDKSKFCPSCGKDVK